MLFGKILGSRFLRREGRPSDEAILSGRLVDRAIRPLFNNRIRKDIQIVVTIMSFDENTTQIWWLLITASAAILSSNIPWKGGGGVKVAKIDGKIIINPKLSELSKGKVEFETFVAGSRDKSI